MGLEKPHAVFFPFPAQGHINPMMMLAKLLHSHGGFHITFVLTHYNHARLLRSRGPHALDGLPSFRFVSIPDGLSSSDGNSTQPIPDLFRALDNYCLGPFTDLLKGLNVAAETGRGPPVSCIVSDGLATFTLDAAEALGIREVLFWTASTCGFMGYKQYPRLVAQGYIPLKDANQLTNGYLDTTLDWIPSMKGIRLKDIPSFIRTTDPNDISLNYLISTVERSHKASAIIFNTFEAWEGDFLAALAPEFPPFFPIGPLHTLEHTIQDEETQSIGSNLWKEDQHCMEWLDSNDPGSVLYINYGSITVMTNDHLVEFAFGLANSGKRFLWVIRPDLVTGDSRVLPTEFEEETKERSLLVDWCDQDKVLNHVAVGGFLTHSGWNSTMESVCAGVPMISWPFFAEQQTNCWANREVWGIGMEIDSDVKRENVEKLVRELMDGDKGKEMKRKTMELKMLGKKAIAKGTGDSWKSLEKLIKQVLIPHY
ncbi:hypothetical protein V2J09_013852 [Rumex salicifolius]